MQAKPTTKAKQFMTLHGVPSGLLDGFSFDINIAVSKTTLELNGGTFRNVTTMQQIAWYTMLQKYTPLTASIILFSSEQYYLLARQAATILFWSYLSKSLNYPKFFDNSKPLWYTPGLEFRDKLLTEYNAGNHIKPNLLVLDSLSTNMPAMKASKVHDILQAMCDRPRLLLMHGENTYRYCIDRLGVRPKYLLNFAPAIKRNMI